MSYKVGDKVLVEGEVVEIDNSQMVNTRIAFKDDTDEWFSEKLLFDASKTYEDGLNDAWGLARKLLLVQDDGGYAISEIRNIFGTSNECKILRELSVQEAFEKLEAYEKGKQIKIGDVVKHIHAEKQYEFAVTALNGMGVQGIGSDGNIFMVSQKEVEKTGRHIDISSLLEQIRGDE